MRNPYVRQREARAQCDELEGCFKFDWLGDYSKVLKGKLIDYKGKTKTEIASLALKAV